MRRVVRTVVGTSAATASRVTLRPRLIRLPLVVLLTATAGVGGEAPRDPVAGSQRPAAVDGTAVVLMALSLGGSTAEAESVRQVYGTRPGWAWTSPAGTLTRDGEAALARLHGAERHALDPRAYLTPVIAAALDLPPAAADAGLRRDVALTLAVLRYMRHLHLGRVDPRSIGLRLQAWDEPHDFPSVLVEAIGDRRVAAALDDLAPPLAVYGQLADALARYRALDGLNLPAVPAAPRTIRAGDRYDGADAVARRLVLFGDLAVSDAPPPGTPIYDQRLSAAVARFQARHGLAPDGALGPRTIAALQVPVSTRVQQITLALERLRWLPDLGTRRVVVVNIPMFHAWAWEAGQLAAPPARSMAVIVGRAMRTQTPVFVATLGHVVFRPYWNVPASIVRGEVLPAIRKDPGYIARQQMEIVRGGGDDARVVAPDAEAIAALAAGTLRIRQRPGAHNALGLVKFDFPSHESVYMHDTPGRSLFARERRDFSHGCIRVADPAGLAAWVLTGVAGWTPDAIAAAMGGTTTRRVNVAAPIDVVLFYLTAAVSPDDGTLRFADDIYGHDVALARALLRRR